MMIATAWEEETHDKATCSYLEQTPPSPGASRTRWRTLVTIVHPTSLH